ncbi:hypothetical protein M413DRAFT_32411 [Hebeloma cylindrosporum]|uniref:RNase H type-1 domain-containing protein n=1 Tax=Hebeloma cylindrosporum TaxID=76867 RepID=A0A0C3BVX1_HEBCY|nr:hypothetical protein M413DRAFT_32411 [Hebeloma cylindrosporum h7]
MDNQAAIQALAKPKRKSGPYLIIAFHRLLDRHTDIPGNEKADANAHNAAAGECSPLSKLPSILRKTLPLSSLLGPHSNSRRYLLSTPKGIKHSLTFIHNTRCFPAYHDIAIAPNDDPPSEPPDVTA